MRFVAITYRKGAALEVTFGGNHAQRPQELVDVDEFIGIKSHRAKGKRITTYDVASLRFIEPETPEEDDYESEDVEEDVAGAEEPIDISEILGDDARIEPTEVYTPSAAGEDAGILVSQLDLFS